VIVDVHSHGPTHRDVVPPDEAVVGDSWREGEDSLPLTTTWADYDSQTRAADVSIICNIAIPDGYGAFTPRPYASVNRVIEEFVAARPSKRIGFMSLHPDDPNHPAELERCRAAGLKGIKLGPNYQVFDPLGRNARRLYRYAEREGLPILFHQGTSPIRFAPNRYSHPLLMDEIAIDYPDLKIVMAHLGHPFTRETVTIVRKHPHVYADVSMLYVRPWTCYEGLVMASEWGVMDKLLFGSDYPHSTPQDGIERLRAVNDILAGTALPRISAEQIEAIIHADALDRLGLEDPRQSPGR
jgi:predicted TIM-barrel fold metal-dependent hydrolase